MTRSKYATRLDVGEASLKGNRHSQSPSPKPLPSTETEMPNKMPRAKTKTKLKAVMFKQKQRQRLARTGAVTLLVGLITIGCWKLFSNRSATLDTSNGMSLLPQDTFFSVSISTDAERWQKFTEFGVPVSRGIFQQQIAKFQTDFLTYYGYDYQRDIQPWIGKQILFGYLDNPATGADPTPGKVARQQTIAILPIADMGAAQRVVEQHQTPIDANLVESKYKGVAIREFKRKTGTMAIAIIDNYVAITTDKSALEQAIDTAKSGKSLLAVPGYAKALTEIEIDKPFAQVYMNIPVAMAVSAASSPKTLDPTKLAQAQIQQGIAANATLEADGIAWKGISWLKPDTKEKFVVENQGQNLAEKFPADTLMMVSGGNLQRVWQDYVRSAATNPIPAFRPNDVVKDINLKTGLDLESDVLNWSKGPFAAAIVPKPANINTELATGWVIFQQASDRSAAEKAFDKLDNKMAQTFKVNKVQIGGKDAIEWASPLSVIGGTHGWLDKNMAFLNFGAPATSTFLPQPQSRLSDTPLFQQSTRSNLDHHNGQFFLDVDRTINVDNTQYVPLSPEVKASLQAVKSIGVTSAIFDESSNRFDLFVALKKVPGVAQLPTPPKATKPATPPITAPAATPTLAPSPASPTSP